MEKVRIDTIVPLTIFEKPVIKEHSDALFCNMENDIKKRIDEILKYINENLHLELTEDFSYSSLYHMFKFYFYECVLKDAVNITLTEPGKYNIIDNILSLLTTDSLKLATYGFPMLNAFKSAIKKLPSSFDTSIRDINVMLIEKKFLTDSILLDLKIFIQK